jgi:hypothetical protein
VELDSARSANIIVNAVASYSGSTVTLSKNGDTFNSGELLPLSAGDQSKITVDVYNEDSGVSLQYELVVIRPLPVCSLGGLSQW